MRLFAILAVLLLPLAARAAPFAHWIQLGPGGVVEERAVVGGTQCPSSNGMAMTPRAAGDDSFPLVCARAVTAASPSVKQARNPQRIVVIGDTGCRIKPPALQDCSDITKWPFPLVAASAAKLNPDLVIHVGDYLYRESACPPGNAGCAGTPFGDNWPSWNADFFAPARPLLAAAPWIVVRGNHEECARSGRGFTRLLGPGPYDPSAPCAPHEPPYAVPAGGMNLVVFDDATAPDTSIAGELMGDYRSDFASLATISRKPIWLLMHRPIWGLITGPFGIPVGGNRTLIAAAGDQSSLVPVALMLSGHIHTFEAINYTSRVPPQIIAGNAGDNLDPTPMDLRGGQFQGDSGVAVKDGLSVGGFGFLVMNRRPDGDWSIDLHRADGSNERQCIFAAGCVDCSVASKK